jgi:hypothetical protein
VKTQANGALEVPGESVSSVVSVLVQPDRKSGSATKGSNGYARASRGD